MGKAKPSSDDFISTPKAGVELGVSASRVQILIRTGRLPALKVGKTWIIRRSDLDLVRDRPTGRPRKEPSGDKTTEKKKSTMKKKRKKPKDSE
jgi:excisionase family DNA binding protein